MLLHAQTSFVGEFCGERLVYRENRYRDGTTYALTVFTGDDGFYGVFTCPNCERTELSTTLSESLREAIQQALLTLDAHHSANHLPSSHICTR